MKIIELTQNKVTVVDDEDYEILYPFKWCAFKTKWGCYAARSKNGKIILMHRQILNAPSNMVVDHINHDGLDNRRINIRLATVTENNRNKRIMAGKSCEYKGIRYIQNKSKPWRAEIRLNKKTIHIGFYFTAIEAALAYDKKAVELFGEFAFTNLLGDRDA